jgi:hypothetical protein
MAALPSTEAGQQRTGTEAPADESTVSAKPKKKLATYALCWHECPACHRTWFHRTHNSKTADRYLAKCPTCLNPHQPGDLNS